MKQISEQKAIELYQQHQKYMKAYNKRPYVKSKRTQYNKARWQLIKQAGELLRGEEKNDDNS